MSCTHHLAFSQLSSLIKRHREMFILIGVCRCFGLVFLVSLEDPFEQMSQSIIPLTFFTSRPVGINDDDGGGDNDDDDGG